MRVSARGWRLSCVLGSVVLSVLVPGCKAAVGSSCSDGQAACLDDRSELVCEAGKFMASPCKGPGGCKIEGSNMTCDVSANAAGDTCGKASEGHANCTTDKKNKIVCAAGKYVISPCRGPEGCRDGKGSVTCDMSVAVLGDACSGMKGGAYACSADKKSLLECKAGKFVVNETCKKGCGMKGDAVGCDLPP